MNITFLNQQSPKEIRVTLPGNHFYIVEDTGYTGTLLLEVNEARAFVFGVFKPSEETVVNITQHHRAKNTTSRVMLRALMNEPAKFLYEGKIHIEKGASGSDAAQEARGLLLHTAAHFSAIPSLEILPSDVTCKHEAAVSPLSEEQLWFLSLRGLDPLTASHLLQKSFLNSLEDSLSSLSLTDAEDAELRTKLSQNIAKLYA